jgi:hypothetical protein
MCKNAMRGIGELPFPRQKASGLACLRERRFSYLGNASNDYCSAIFGLFSSKAERRVFLFRQRLKRLLQKQFSFTAKRILKN